MKVLFLLTMIRSKAKWHQGLGSLSAFLSHHGHQVSLLEVYRLDFNLIDEAISQFQPDVIAATSNSHQFRHVRTILEYLSKKYPHLRIVLGGVHATIQPNCIREIEGVDAICIGEGEGPLLEYVNALDAGKDVYDVENFYFNRDGHIITNPVSYYVKNLDELPIPDRSILKRFREAAPHTPLPFPVRFLFCRGCPFNCSYCCNHTLKATFPEPKRYVRRPSVSKAIDELLEVSESYLFDEFVIDDDIFTLNKEWTLEFCDKYPEKLKGKRFIINVRVGTVDREMLLALKDIGCSSIQVGLEAGDYEIRRKVLNRNISDEAIIETFELAREVGIGTHTFNMIGIPGEDRSKIKKTISLNRRIKPDRMQVTVFYPYRNTALGDYCFENDLVAGVSDSYFSESILNLPDLSEEEIQHYVRYFKLFVYSAYSPGRTLDELWRMAKSTWLWRLPKKIGRMLRNCMWPWSPSR